MRPSSSSARWTWPIEAAAKASGSNSAKSSESGSPSYSSVEHLLDLLPGHRRRVGAQLRELLLVDLAVLVGDELGVDEGGELAELHRRALHLARARRPSSSPSPGGAARAAPCRPPRSGRRWRPWSRRSGRPARRRSSPASPSGELCPWGSSSRRPSTRRLPQVAVSRRFSILSRPMASARETLKAAPRAEFGSRTSRRLRREGLVPGVVYSGGARGARLPGRRTRGAQRARRRRRAVRPRDRGRRKPCRSWSRSSSCTRCAATSSTSTCRRCGSTRRSRPRSRSSSRAPRSRPASRAAACSSTSPARSPSKRCRPRSPTGSSPTSRRWRSTTRCSSRRSVVPEGVKFVADDPDEVTIATLSPPRVEEEPEPAVEEEAELVGEEGEAPDAERGAARPRAATRATPTGSSPCRSSAAAGRARRGRAGRPHPHRRPRQPRARVRGDPPQRRLRGRRGARRGAGTCRGRRPKFGGLIAEGRAGPGGPRVAILLPQTYMNDSGDSAGPARGSLKVPLDRVVVLHDEIDLPFGEVAGAPRRRARRPQRAEEPQARLRRRRVLAGAGRGRQARLDRSRGRLLLRARALPRAAARRSRR